MFTSLDSQVHRLDVMERDILDNVGEIPISSKTWFMFRVYRDRIRKSRGAVSNLSYKLNKPVSFIYNIDEEPVETTTDVEVALRQILEQLKQNIELMGIFSRDRAKILRLLESVRTGTDKSIVAEQKMNECLSLMGRVPEIEKSVKAVLLEHQADQAAAQSKNNSNSLSTEKLLNKILLAKSGSRMESIDPMCLNVGKTWQRCSFVYDGSYTDCHGSQYVRLSGYDVGRYVGVVTCGEHRNKRYKIFLGDSLSSKFLSIADLNGKGEDHCEFLGAGSSPYWRHSMSYTPGTFEGYLRRRRGEPPVRRTLHGSTGHYSPKWYECGVAVP
ncbi:uncharacterized protein LOC135469066 [Liolophura sinensis]|uniref:uncharacterized protein LOC135469066 n=1 Tax=Liolophura sinensis TaxID=3198878 RepID=UPI0031582F8E